MFQLYDRYAHRYDLHTPPTHYQHDHQFVIELAREAAASARLLDVGCGTGVLIEKAIAAGIDARGFDASPTMIAAAHRRVDHDRAWVQRMESLDLIGDTDLLVATSWVVHYAENVAALTDTLARFHRALAPNGRILLQIAHRSGLPTEWAHDAEPGPGGPDDVCLSYRFSEDSSREHGMIAAYQYRCLSQAEAFEERHPLLLADAPSMARLAAHVGFESIALWASWRRDPFDGEGSVWLYARRAA